jgi:hypothetical protein
MQLALGGSYLGVVNMEVADRVYLELSLRLLILGHFRRSADAMALQTAS